MSYKVHFHINVDSTKEQRDRIREEIITALDAYSLEAENLECKEGSLEITFTLTEIVVAAGAFVVLSVATGFLNELGCSIYRVFNCLIKSKDKEENAQTQQMSSQELKNEIAHMLGINQLQPNDIKPTSFFPTLEKTLGIAPGTTVSVSKNGEIHGMTVTSIGDKKLEITRFHTSTLDLRK